MRRIRNKIALAVLSGVIAAGGTVFGLGNTAYAAEAEVNNQPQIIEHSEESDANGNYEYQYSAEVRWGDCTPDNPQCRPDWQGQRGYYGHNMDNLAIAERLAKDYGVKRAQVIDALYAKVDFRDLKHACMISKISGKSLESIMIAHHNQHWPELEASLGITPDDIYNARQELMAERLAEKAHADKAVVLKLLQKNYHPRDIEIAGILAQESGRSVEGVLNKMTLNKNWHDVAAELKVDWNEMQKNHFDHHHGMHRGGNR